MLFRSQRMRRGALNGTLEPRTESEAEELGLIAGLPDDEGRQIDIDQPELCAPRDTEAGADTLVAGTAFFKAPDRRAFAAALTA